MRRHEADATALAAALARGDFSARELVSGYISRIETRRDLNAVVCRRFDEALAEADTADVARARGDASGPLAGVPITVKEAFDVAGLPTTLGHISRKAHVASADAVAVSRLKASGAILLGKTNVPKDLADWQSFNDVYGVTLSPWSDAVTPGGSSGGSAVALAAGLSALELGSDIAGSIRVPASYCGVWGLKPTWGVVPLSGHGLDPDEPPTDILVAGPMARSARDLALALDLIAGPDGTDPLSTAWTLQLPAEKRTLPRDFRIAIVDSDPSFPVDGAIREAIARLAIALEKEGASVDRAPTMPMPATEHYRLFIALLRAATSARIEPATIDRMRASPPAFADNGDYDALMHKGLTQTHRDWLAANAQRHALQARWRTFFESYDALICPVTTTPAFPHMRGVPKGEQRFLVDGAPRPAADCYYWIGIPSLSGLPAVSSPIGLSPAGLPVGIQIVGAPCQDKRCIRIAELIEHMLGPFRGPPDH